MRGGEGILEDKMDWFYDPDFKQTLVELFFDDRDAVPARTFL